MYYIVKVDNEWKSVLYSGEYSDSLYNFIKKLGVEIAGQYGRKDYADARVEQLNYKETK